MIFDSLVLLVKAIGFIMLVLLVRAIQKHLKIRSDIKRITSQGGFFVPKNNDTFLLGPLLTHIPKYEELKKTQVVPPIFGYFFSTFIENRAKDEPRFNAAKTPMTCYNMLGRAMTLVADPEVVSDIYGKHNKDMQKSAFVGDVFKPMIEDIFGFMPTNDAWRHKRKATSNMFFSKSLSQMLDVFKHHLNKKCDKWLAEIESKGETKIDISVEFERLFADTIINICFG